MTPDELILRRLLWFRHNCPLAALYGDDGEMQCNSCGIDFKRFTAQEIDEAFIRIGMQRLIEAQRNGTLNSKE